MAASHNRLRIKSLKFVSAVDAGAQGKISDVALLKRAPNGKDIEAVCKVVSTEPTMGIVFGWALASSLDGGLTDHVDLQKDAVIGDDDLIKVAADYMERGGASDVMHDDVADGRVVFAMPLTAEVNAALGIKSDTHGLAIGMKPSAETFKRFVSGELKAFSIGGVGERTPVEKSKGKTKPADEKDENEDPDAEDPDAEDEQLEDDETDTKTKSGKKPWMKGANKRHTAEVISPPARSAASVSVKEPTAMADTTARITELEASNARLAKMATLTDAQRAHLTKLNTQDAESFLAKSAHERDVVLSDIAKADEVIYKAKSGREYRKSESIDLINMAKQVDSLTEAKDQAEIAKREAEFAKRGDEVLSNFAKGTKKDLRGRIMRALNAEFTDPDEYKEAVETMKGANALFGEATKSRGYTPSGGAESMNASSQLDNLTKRYADEHKISVAKASDEVLKTDEGKRLYAAMDARA